jgi:hypothetical protein
LAAIRPDPRNAAASNRAAVKRHGQTQMSRTIRGFHVVSAHFPKHPSNYKEVAKSANSVGWRGIEGEVSPSLQYCKRADCIFPRKYTDDFPLCQGPGVAQMFTTPKPAGIPSILSNNLTGVASWRCVLTKLASAYNSVIRKPCVSERNPVRRRGEDSGRRCAGPSAP